MRIILDTRLSVEQNAARYFEKAKKAKRKLEGAKKALASTLEKMKEAPKEKKAQVQKVVRKKEWYEAFRWFLSSDGLLCIGGRDATTNEIVVKKHAEKGDLAFHTDMAGSPFVIIKAAGNEIPQTTIDEASQFTAAYSRAWKLGLSQIEVFHVKPDQLSKTANTGEFVPKGAFMVRGRTEYQAAKMELCVGKLEDGRMMIGPQRAVTHHCGHGWLILPGDEKTSDIAKKLAKLYDVHPDEIIPLLPPQSKLSVKVLRH